MLDAPLKTKFRAVGNVVVVALCAGFSVASLGSMVLSTTLWTADLANFLRPHLLLFGMCLFVLSLLFRHLATAVLGAFALLSALSPFFFLPVPASAQGGVPFTVVSANVYVDNPDPADFLALPVVADADILVLQEMTPRWQDALATSGRWPFESSRALHANTDMKLFSRFPILAARTISPESSDTGGRYAMRYELAVGDRTLIVYAVHPQTPRSPRMWRQRSAYLRDLAQAIRSEQHDTPVVVAGDWNTPSWSPFFKDLLSYTGYKTTESRWWPLPTRFSIRFGSLTQLGTPIDRIVLSPAVGLDRLAMGPTFGSNHLPVIARLTLP
ncbi:endonuclease/exonuclease/phosphatase family protein [Nitratireductor rhodophyticola]|jgi:endonuclease/exonuclease/phosphatase (EEP) superfamily protein YafD|uniref:endonuclease/exonuclease/phosphatase family protein n=1 Tax=Nitratireductor rhodophyticola TaxID=2854036 RepID=UPI00268A4976